MLNEGYKVDLLKKLPPFHRKIYEFQQIANAQIPELEALIRAVDSILDDFFVTTATEYGISRLEKIVGIIPEVGSDLETRRYTLLSKMTENISCTDETLEERLISLCGEGGYNIIRDYINYKISVDVSVGVVGVFDSVCNLLLEMLPCNLDLTITNTLTQNIELQRNIVVGISVSHSYLIINDITAS